ncbi:MAG: outer membrane adhesin-like protein, partial [Limisphaerales bacterium]
ALTISYATLAAAANAADVDGDTLSFRIEAVSGGTLTKGGSAVTPGTTLLGTGESLVWTPAADANGTLNAFTVKATDGTLASAAAVQVQVVVAAVNDAPTLTTVTALTGGTEDTALTITYATLAAAANEADVDVGDTLSFRIETLSGGTLTKGGSAVTPGTTLLGTGESLVWTPAANANGTLNAFTVKATDGTLASAAAVQVQVTVNAVNDAPTRTAGSVATLTVLEDAAATALGLGPLAYAAGPADEAAQTLTYTVTAVPASTLGDVVLTDGTTVVSANTTYTLAQLQGMKFKPAANANGGPATFSFTVKDNGGTTSGGVDTLTESLTVTATPVNDAPSGTNRTSGSREGPVTTLEDTAYTFAAADFGFSDNTDTPANALKAVKITTLPAAGGLANNGVAVVAGAFVSASDISSGQLKFTPATNANGTAYASFTFQVQDDGGTANGGVDLDASPKTLTLNVTPVNDPPSFALPPGSSVIVWGLIGFAPTEIPANLSGVTAIAAGHVDTVALKSDGTVVAWGPSAAPVPATLSGVTAIAAGATHTVALKSDGTVVAWGDNTSGQTTIPANLSGVTAIAAGGDHTVALKNDGTVVAWGRNAEGQTTIPATLSGVTAIAAGGAHTVALKNDGTVVAWGWNFSGQTTIPANLSGVTAIAAGGLHTVALKRDGTVVAWGANSYGQTTIPANLSGVTAIAAGYMHTVALKRDATVVAWGDNTSGQTTIPANLSGVTAIAAGGNHTVALGASQRDFILSFADGNISSGYHERDSFIASISGGPANEAHNGLRFNFSTDLPELFTEAPHFAGSDDTVQFTLASFKAGVATVTVTLTDDSTQGGPALTSAAETFTITVLGLGCPIVELLKPQPSPQSVSPQSLGLRVAADVAPAISLATFHALEGLLGDSAEGRRLKNLYRAHGTEIVQIMQAQPALRTQMTSVITSFQPLVVALLSGRAQQVQITQAMTDQLNVMWNTMTNFASPSLAGTLNTERTRFNGFQDFVGRDFSQWAAMLQVPAPTKPRVNISDIGRPTNGMLSLEANLVEGADVALWGSPDLINWSPVPGAVRQTNGFSLWLTDPNPSNLRRFYRLQTGP